MKTSKPIHIFCLLYLLTITILVFTSASTPMLQNFIFWKNTAIFSLAAFAVLYLAWILRERKLRKLLANSQENNSRIKARLFDDMEEGTEKQKMLRDFENSLKPMK